MSAPDGKVPSEFTDDDEPPPLIEVSDDQDDATPTPSLFSPTMFVAIGRADHAANNETSTTNDTVGLLMHIYQMPVHGHMA